MGTVLAQALGGKLNSAIQISNHQIELAYRHGVDERRLGHYLKRQGQIDDFLKLLEARDNTWALHYIGMGGIGKTMLLRYITARLAANPREELPSNAIPYDDLPTCRVDFDYLTPVYPIREPGRLLLMLAEELRQYGFSDRHEFLFNELQSQCAKLHESLSSVSSGNPLAFLGLPAFENVVRTFAELVQLQSRPVILILDTCEELAKVSSAAMLPNVIATLHAGAGARGGSHGARHLGRPAWDLSVSRVIQVIQTV